MFLLDTNVVSEMRRGNKASPNFVRWAGKSDGMDFYLSVISVMEIETGILLLARKDKVQAHILRDWLESQLLPDFQSRLLDLTLPIALRCAALHVPNPKSERDAMIAATALVHGFTVVTRNDADFAASGVAIVNPWKN